MEATLALARAAASALRATGEAEEGSYVPAATLLHAYAREAAWHLLLLGRLREAENEFAAAAAAATTTPYQQQAALEGEILSLLLQAKLLEAGRKLERAERLPVSATLHKLLLWFQVLALPCRARPLCPLFPPEVKIQ